MVVKENIDKSHLSPPVDLVMPPDAGDLLGECGDFEEIGD